MTVLTIFFVSYCIVMILLIKAVDIFKYKSYLTWDCYRKYWGIWRYKRARKRGREMYPLGSKWLGPDGDIYVVIEVDGIRNEDEFKVWLNKPDLPDRYASRYFEKANAEGLSKYKRVEENVS